MECPKCKTVIPEGKLYCPSCGYAVQIVPDYDADLEDNLDSASSDIAGTVNRIDVSDSVRTEYDIDATTKEIPMVKKDEASDIKRRTEQDRERSDQITTVIVAGLLLVGLIVGAVIASKSMSKASFIPQQAVENAVTSNAADRSEEDDETMTEAVPDEEVSSNEEPEAAPVHDWQLLVTPGAGSMNGPQKLIASVSDNSAPDNEFTGIIYYTDDGSEPDETSKIFRGDSEIWLPLGKSRYAFRFMDGNGNMSEPVYLDYDLGGAGACSAADAANYCIVNLIQRGVLADVYGHVLGSLGTFTYEAERMVGSGSRSYYVIKEYYSDPGGSPKPTGNLYAIDAENLSFCRAKQGSGGKYVFEEFY